MTIPVRIASIEQGTPTIKLFTLDLGGQEFDFLPGQWVDCYAEIGGRLEVAGYSMTSSPLTRGTIDLAVKIEGENPVTHFLHRRAEVGTLLHIDGGQGDFYYRREMGDSVVLIGGGIGLTPLMSIIRHIDEAEPEVRATLVYAAATPSELLFRKQLERIASRSRKFRCLFTVTRLADEPWTGHLGRIDAAMLGEAQVEPHDQFYICGPPAMIQDMVALLDERRVPATRILYEGW